MIVGIMSMQRIINYGSFLQAWGLKKILEKMGNDIQFVDFTVGTPLVESIDDGKRKKTRFERLISMLGSGYRKQRNIDIKVNRIYGEFIQSFKEEWFPLLNVQSERNIRPVLDLLVIGSDEVFHCMQPETNIGYSLELFGKDNRAKRVISYAASFGATTMEQLHKYSKDQELGLLLKEFDALSVRDISSLELVECLCGKKPELHIDPVLLYDFEEEVPKEVFLKDYVILYSYCGRFTKEEGQAAREFAHAKGKKLISLGFWQECCDEYVKATPFEVLAYFKHADYIITDTFHGTVMSIKYNKQFICLVRPSNKQKMSSLLNEFSLTERIVESANEFSQKMLCSIDYCNANEYLKKQQIRAKEYLWKQIQILQ